MADPLRIHVIVIDALDECGLPDEQRILAKRMLSLVSDVPWIKVVVTSRPEPEIRDVLDNRCVATDINQEEDTAADIELFIRTKLVKLKLTVFDDKVNELVARASGLFIWCSTLFKYLSQSRNPRRDMHNFLSGSTEQNPLTQLYILYDQILSSAVDMGHQEDVDVLQAVLGIIYVCSSNKPLSANAIAGFLQHNPRFLYEDVESVSGLTRKLHAVLYEESNGCGALRVYHPSFLDYLERKLTQKDGFIMSLSAVHELMASGCLAIMQKELMFNICCLEDSYRLNKDVQDLEERIAKHISEALRYGCLSWFAHVSKCDLRTVHDELFGTISSLVTSPKILYWLEVLSLLDEWANAVTILRKCCAFFEVRHPT